MKDTLEGLYEALDILGNLEPEYEGSKAIPLQDAIEEARDALKKAIDIYHGED